MGVQGGVRGGGSRRLQRERRRQRVVQEKLQKHQRQGQTPVSAKSVSHVRAAVIKSTLGQTIDKSAYFSLGMIVIHECGSHVSRRWLINASAHFPYLSETADRWH